MEEDIKGFLHDVQNLENITALHMNLRSLKSNFDGFCDLLNEVSFIFNVICLTETWCDDNEILTNSTFHIPNYDIFLLKEKQKDEAEVF